MQAALGASQIAKLPDFIERRKANFRHLFYALQPLQDVLVLPEVSDAQATRIDAADRIWAAYLARDRDFAGDAARPIQLMLWAAP